MLKELEEYKANHDNLEKKMKNADESFTSRQKDLESKIQQEKTKFEQKAKDYAKLGTLSNQNLFKFGFRRKLSRI